MASSVQVYTFGYFKSEKQGYLFTFMPNFTLNIGIDGVQVAGNLILR